jgi:hypothetical protein
VFRAFYGQSVRQSEFGKVLSKSSLLWSGHTEHLLLSESDILNRVAFKLKQFVLARSFTYFKNLFIDLGLDHYVQSAIDIEVFRACYGQSVRQSEFGKVLSKSS